MEQPLQSQAALFTLFGQMHKFTVMPTIGLRGLDADAHYRIEMMDRAELRSPFRRGRVVRIG